MYGNYMGAPFMMSGFGGPGAFGGPASYGNIGMMRGAMNGIGAMNGAALRGGTMNGGSLGGGLRSLLGLGGIGGRGAAIGRGINWSSLLNNTSKTIGVVKEAIPIVKEAGPMLRNMKSIIKVASVFKDETDTTGGGTDGDVKSTTTDLGNGTYSTDNSNLSSNYNSNEPNFFL